MDNNINSSYKNYIEVLKIEFGEFLRLCENGRTVRFTSLKARKKSIKLRELLKQFRTISLENDQRISRILTEAKNRIGQDIVDEDIVDEDDTITLD